MKGLGPIQKKILILAFGGLAISLTSHPGQQFRIIGEMRREWKKISKQNLERAINKLYQSRLLDLKLMPDGKWKMSLTKKGKKQSLLYDLATMEIKKPAKWDRKWRVVAFDIPERHKRVRDIFRDWLKRLHFYKLQDSVFVHPYDCRNEFDFLVEFYRARRFVRYMVADEIDNEPHLKKIFSLR